MSVAAAAGAAVVAHGLGTGLHTLRGVPLAIFLLGGVALVGGVFLVNRAIRRRARLEVIATLLPRYRENRRDDQFSFDQVGLEGEPSGRIPTTHAEIRNATRALLASLEEEVRRDTGHARRSKRPACRRARLRLAGQSERSRRRVAHRRITTFS